ncbi:hypothetical protein M011DRAFT_276334 [Sporormia fimetaria CBS 119925]|uniref:Uncharacterized protein n=1 Tax=Sporormia fimetaria CBS 119925 TaxID=1340428 RepID=A0A6A6VGS1_9PLEO|nr:hypothetical protein M011DRAFT_276334 [Sporormia fimetaria CBS 119925]
MKQAMNLIFVSENISQASWSLWLGLQRHLQSMFVEAEENLAQSQRRNPVQPDTTDPTPLHRKDPLQLRKPPESVATNRLHDGKAPVVEIDLTLSDDEAPRKPPATRTSSSGFAASHAAAPSTHRSSGKVESEPKPRFEIRSYKTLPDFYSLLDRIERTSYVGAVFLEAYAEHLHRDECRDCWVKRNIDLTSKESEDTES